MDEVIVESLAEENLQQEQQNVQEQQELTAEEIKQREEKFVDQMMNLAQDKVEEVVEIKQEVVEEKKDEYPSFKELGFNSYEELKSEIERLKVAANKPAEKIPYKYENENAEKIAALVNSGDYAGLKKWVDSQVLMSGIDNMNSEEKLKLYIKMQNPILSQDQELIDDEYNSTYKVNEDDFDDPLALKREKLRKEQRIYNDLEKANEFFKNHSTKVQLPNISVPQEETDDFKEFKAQKESISKAYEYFENVISPSINALKEDDLKMVFELNEPKNQMQFRVSITPNKEHLADAKQKALDWDNYLRNTVYDKDGNFLANNAALLILRNERFGEYAQSAARQSVNAERARVVKAGIQNGNGGVRVEQPTISEVSYVDKMMGL